MVGEYLPVGFAALLGLSFTLEINPLFGFPA